MHKNRFFSVLIALVTILSLPLAMIRNTVKAQNQPHPSPGKPDTVTITPEFMSRMDGLLYSVAWQDNYAYVGISQTLVIVDVSDPAQLITTGQTGIFPDVVWEVAVAGNKAYVANDSNGLRIIDIANPAAPAEVGYYGVPGGARGVTVVGNYAYVAAGAGLRILDIANPAAPTQVGSYDTPYAAVGVTVAGNYAYVAAGDGLHIINISNPAAPAQAGFSATPGGAWGVAVAGSYAYVAALSKGLRIVAIANPAAPVEVGFYAPTSSSAEGVAVAGSYAYVADGWNGLRILDVSNPAEPAEAGFYARQGDYSYNVTVAGNDAYLADFEGLMVFRLLTDKVTSPILVTGGSLASTDGNTNLIFPASAFTETVNLTYRQLLYDENTGALFGIGHIFDLTAVYSDTGQTASLAPGQTFTVTVDYADAETGPAIESTLALYAWNGSAWEKEPTSRIDTGSNLITATPDHLSLWAVLGEALKIYIPLVRKQ